MSDFRFIAEQQDPGADSIPVCFLVLGISHNTASIELRERVAFTPDVIGEALSRALDQPGLHEISILSTCNRTELYAVCDRAFSGELLAWLAAYHDLTLEVLEPHHYLYRDEDAVQHLLRVASGLDSMVLGEPQILGQFKSAFALARDEGTVGVWMDRLFRHVSSEAKRIRTDTAIGENPVSVAYAAVSLARRIFADLQTARVMLIGAGSIMQLVARHLLEQGVSQIMVANRSLERARELGDEFAAQALLLGEIPERLYEADIVISSTASQLPILGKGAVESALRRRRRRPMFMVDLAVPRDVEPEVGQMQDVYLYTVDDLRDVVEEGMASRREAADAAEQMVRDAAISFLRDLRALEAVDTLRAYRGKVDTLREAEMLRARRQLERGEDPLAVLESFAHRFANKLMHEPSQELRRAGAEGRRELLDYARALFRLDDQDPSA